MSTKAPDTRNKLDNNKGIKGIKKNHSQPKKKHKIKKKSFKNTKELKEAFDGKEKPKLEKLTEAQCFKKNHGYSLTTAKLMKKYKVNTLEEYKFIRKKRQEAEKKLKQKKHADSVAYKRAHGKKKGSKGSTPKTKVKK